MMSNNKKVIVRNLFACAALAFALSPYVATASLIQTADDNSTGDQAVYAGTVLDDDLIDQNGSTLSSVDITGYTATESALNPGTPDFVLNDGTNGGTTTGSNLSNGAAADSDKIFQVTYNLDLSTNTAGYDLTRIRSYTAASNNRTQQGYEVLVDFVGGGVNFVSLGTFSGGVDGGEGATRLTLENDTNSGVDAFASGVAAIRFSVDDAGHNYAAWREFDVVGSATIIPEPNSVILLVTALFGICALRRRNRCCVKA